MSQTNELVVEAFAEKDTNTLELAPTPSSDDFLRFEFEITRVGSLHQTRWSRIRFCIADYPGAWLERDAMLDPEVEDLQNFIYASHVLIAPIDTPSMMNDTWHRRTNRPEQIKNWLDLSISSKRRSSPMLILLVPVRCEEYLRRTDGARALQDLTRERYADIIHGLIDSPAGDHVAIAITPVKTFGTASYQGQREGAGKREYEPRFAADHIESVAEPDGAEQPLLYIISFLLNCRRLARNATTTQIQEYLNWNQDLDTYLSELQKIRKVGRDGFEIVHDPQHLLQDWQA
ncbi:hypothetical protein ACFQ9X_17350 [Catenulispora yoronensis]